MRTFLADILCLCLLPVKAVLLLLIPVLLMIAVFYAIPVEAHFRGDAEFAAERFPTSLFFAVGVFSALYLAIYWSLSKSERSFAGYFTARELRAVLLAALALTAFVAVKMYSEYKAGDYEMISRPLKQIHSEWYHLVTDPAAHLNGGEPCEECTAFAESLRVEQPAELEIVPAEK